MAEDSHEEIHLEGCPMKKEPKDFSAVECEVPCLENDANEPSVKMEFQETAEIVNYQIQSTGGVAEYR